MKPLYLLKTVWLFQVISVILAASVLNGCQTTPDNVTEIPESPSWESELYQVNLLRSNFQKYVRTKQWDSLRTTLSTNAKIIPPGSETWKFIWSKAGPEWPIPYDSIRIDPIETVRLNDSMVYDWGRSTVYYTDENDSSQTVQNSYLVLLKKENGKWTLYREVASATVFEN